MVLIIFAVIALVIGIGMLLLVMGSGKHRDWEREDEIQMKAISEMSRKEKDANK